MKNRMKLPVKKHVLTILLLAGLTACAPSGGTVSSQAAAEPMVPKVADAAVGISQLQDLDGYWKLDNSNELILFRSNFDSSFDGFETRVAGLNAEKDFAYRFYGLAEGDRLKLEKLEQTNAYGSMVLRALGGGKRRVLKIKVVPTDANSLTIEFATKEKTSSQKFSRASDQVQAQKQYLRAQTDFAWSHIRKTHAGSTEVCKTYINIKDMPLNTDCLRAALESDPNRAKDPDLFSAAVKISNVDMVDLLLSLGADVNAVDRYQQSPISYALQVSGQGHSFDEHGIFSMGLSQTDMLEKLIESGAQLNPENGNKSSVLSSFIGQAGLQNDSHIFELLVAKGAKLSADVDKQGFSTFFYDYNSRWGHQGPAIVTQLIKELGADPNYLFSDKSGGVLSFAIEHADVEALKTLAANGADFKTRTGWQSAVASAEHAIIKQKNLLIERTNTNLQKAVYEAEIKRLQANESYLKDLGL